MAWELGSAVHKHVHPERLSCNVVSPTRRGLREPFLDECITEPCSMPASVAVKAAHVPARRVLLETGLAECVYLFCDTDGS